MSSHSVIIVYTAPGDDRSCCDNSIPRCYWWGVKTLHFIPPTSPPTNLPITLWNISPRWVHKAYSHKQSLFIFKLTGMSMMQSSARQSLVTQCKNTVDILWCLCLTKRKTSKEKRPIWLLPFSKTVVCGSLWQLYQKKHRHAHKMAFLTEGRDVNLSSAVEKQ